MKKHTIVVITHEDESEVFCWGRTSGVKAVNSCLRAHPLEQIFVKLVQMTEEEYDALDDYEGRC